MHERFVQILASLTVLSANPALSQTAGRETGSSEGPGRSAPGAMQPVPGYAEDWTIFWWVGGAVVVLVLVLIAILAARRRR